LASRGGGSKNCTHFFFLLFKNVESKHLIWVFLWRLLLDGVAGVKFLFDGSLKDAMAVLKAHLHFYAALGTLKKKRKLLQQKEVSQIYNHNIVYDHFIKGIRIFSNLKNKRFISSK